MKRFIFSIIIAASGLAAQTANAQIGISIQIGPRVVQRPVAPVAVVYDDFYYLPEVEAYYSVPEHCYYYMDGGRWVNAAYLPGYYHDYDWRNARRYEVHARRPFDNHVYYRNKFGGNAGRDWNRNWDNNQYANRGNNRKDNRDYGRRFPDSPYDSNNAGRGGYYQNDRRDDNRYNNGRRNDNNRGNDRYNNNNRPGNNDNRGNGPDRNQRGNVDINNNRGNDRNNNNRGDNSRGQRLVQNGNQDSRPDFASVKRVAF